MIYSLHIEIEMCDIRIAKNSKKLNIYIFNNNDLSTREICRIQHNSRVLHAQRTPNH